MKTLSEDDHEVLTQMNINIGRYEEQGEWKPLRDFLARQELRAGGGDIPLLAFRRASGACVDARAFLDAISKSPPRSTEITSMTAEGENIAVVRCVVDVGGIKYLNVRLFVRSTAGSTEWRLLAWANETLPVSE